MATRFCCILFFVLACAAAQSSLPSADIDQAIALYKEGKTADAADALAVLLEKAPNDSRVAMLLAECSIRLARYDVAVRALASISSNSDPTVLYLRALALTRDHQIDAGRETIDQLLRKEDTPEVRLMVASIETDAGDFDSAIANVARVIRENPKLPEAHYWRARDLFAAGEMLGAQQAAREELVISPHSFQTNLLLGRILRTCHRAAEAMPFLQEAAAAKPPSEAAFIELADAEIDTARPKEALDLLNVVALHGGSSAGLHRAFARAYSALEREPDAARERRLAAQSDNVVEAEELHNRLLEKLTTVSAQ